VNIVLGEKGGYDFSFVEVALHHGGVELIDPATGVATDGADASLATGCGNSIDAHALQCHGNQCDRLLFAAGEQDIEFPLGWGVVKLVRRHPWRKRRQPPDCLHPEAF